MPRVQPEEARTPGGIVVPDPVAVRETIRVHGSGMTRAEWNDRATLVAPALWVGEVATRADGEHLAAAGIERVLSVLTVGEYDEWSRRAPVPTCIAETPWMALADHDLVGAERMKLAVEFANGGPTLVHCISGRNRSVAVAVCCLVARGWTPTRACAEVFARRGAALAHVYGTACELTPAMIDNVERFAVSVRA